MTELSIYHRGKVYKCMGERKTSGPGRRGEWGKEEDY